MQRYSVRYVSETRDYAIEYGAGRDSEIRNFILRGARGLELDPWGDGDVIWFADSSHGGEKPMHANFGMIGGAPFSWKIGKMRWTTLSVCEGEWFAQTSAATIIQMMLPILTFIHVKVTLPIISFCDNEVAVKIAEADYTIKRLKHVLTRMAYLQEQVKEGNIVLMHIDTQHNIADIGTKLLGPQPFHALRHFLVRKQ